MPWQRLVADVGTEYDPATGVPFYREVWITVPRQSGKSTLMLAIHLERALLRDEPQRIAYTAQDGWSARKKLLEDHVPLLMQSPLSKLVERVFTGAGNDAIVFKNGSRIHTIPSGEAAGHGLTLDHGTIDEAFHDDHFHRENSMIPAMATRPAAQIWGVSTRGTETSLLLNRKVDIGREAVENQTDTGIAYFEWSAPPEADADDEDVWRQCSPALGHKIPIDVIRHARQSLEPDDFRRSYLNIQTAGNVTAIPRNRWRDVNDETATIAGQITLGLDCTSKRDVAALVAVDDSGVVELIDSRSGSTEWCVADTAATAKLVDAPVFIHATGPADVFIEPLRAEGVTVVAVSNSDFATACGATHKAIIDRTIRVRPSGALDLAVDKADQRRTGDRWVWSRMVGKYDATPLVAMSLALWGTEHRPEPEDPQTGFAFVMGD